MADLSMHPDLIPAFSPEDSPKLPRHPYMNGKLIITALIILVVIIFSIGAFHVYARVFWRRRQNRSWHHNQGSRETSRGLDKTIVDTLPTFTYTVCPSREGGDATSKEQGVGVVECAVCLIDFQDNDACRLLPKCKHSFHTECIDMWFLSNTTCPMCRTSAEAIDSGDMHHVDASAEFPLPEQNIGHEISRSLSHATDCLLPHQDRNNHIQRPRPSSTPAIDNHIQRSRSSSFLYGEHIEGRIQHTRRMLARTCSGRVDARYDMVGEEMHNIDTTSGSGPNDGINREGDTERNHSHIINADETLVRHLHLSDWRRSVSDRFLNLKQSVQFPTNVLFWSNHLHMSLRSNTDHWQVGGRSLPHIIIDVPSAQDGFLDPRH